MKPWGVWAVQVADLLEAGLQLIIIPSFLAVSLYILQAALKPLQMLFSLFPACLRLS